LLTEFRTRINLTRRNFANYEGLVQVPVSLAVACSSYWWPIPKTNIVVS
jgi:hypothetical protein